MERKFWAGEEAGIAVYLPNLITSGVNAKGRFGKQDFLEAVQARLDRNPDSVCDKWRMGGTHFQTKSLKTQLPKWRSMS
jgi:hypothetical protein